LAVRSASIPISFLVFRLRNEYFAIGTWVVAEAFQLIAVRFPSLGGGTGASLPGLSGWDPAIRLALTYWAALAVAVLALLGAYLLLRSRIGLDLTAIRDNEVGAGSVGVRVTRAKRIVYLVAAAGAGAAGSLLILSQLNVQAGSVFSVQWSAYMIFVAVIGGVGTIEGPILGTCNLFRSAADASGPRRLVPGHRRRDRGGDRNVRAPRPLGAYQRPLRAPPLPGRLLAPRRPTNAAGLAGPAGAPATPEVARSSLGNPETIPPREPPASCPAGEFGPVDSPASGLQLPPCGSPARRLGGDQLEARLLAGRQRLIAARGLDEVAVLGAVVVRHLAGLGGILDEAAPDGHVVAVEVEDAGSSRQQVLRPVATQTLPGTDDICGGRRWTPR